MAGPAARIAAVRTAAGPAAGAHRVAVARRDWATAGSPILGSQSCSSSPERDSAQPTREREPSPNPSLPTCAITHRYSDRRRHLRSAAKLLGFLVAATTAGCRSALSFGVMQSCRWGGQVSANIGREVGARWCARRSSRSGRCPALQKSHTFHVPFCCFNSATLSELLPSMTSAKEPWPSCRRSWLAHGEAGDVGHCRSDCATSRRSDSTTVGRSFLLRRLEQLLGGFASVRGTRSAAGSYSARCRRPWRPSRPPRGCRSSRNRPASARPRCSSSPCRAPCCDRDGGRVAAFLGVTELVLRDGDERGRDQLLVQRVAGKALRGLEVFVLGCLEKLVDGALRVA